MTSAESTAPLRIAFCITELNFGGAERCLVELANRLDRERFVPSVVCIGPRPAGDASALAEKLDAARVKVQYLNARSSWSAPRVVRQLRRYWRSERLNLVQTFLFHANVLGTFAAWRAGVPLIVTGLRVAEPHRRWRRRLERLTGRLADRHVAVSEGVAKFAREKIGLPAAKVVVIPNGVSLPAEPLVPADLSQFGVARARRGIVFAGRLDEQKGVEWLVEQTPDLLKRLPQHDLLVVGIGPLEARLRSRVERLGVSSRVHFAGWRDDLPSILAAADVLAVPSQWEGMPNVVLEAMTAAKPVVAFNVEGIAEAIGDNASRQTVPTGDREGFVERLIQIASNPALQEDIGQGNRARAESEFDLAKMVRRYERLYLELCAQPLWNSSASRFLNG